MGTLDSPAPHLSPACPAAWSPGGHSCLLQPLVVPTLLPQSGSFVSSVEAQSRQHPFLRLSPPWREGLLSRNSCWVRQVEKERKEKKAGGGALCGWRSASDSWALPCALAWRAQPVHGACCPTGSPASHPRAHLSPAHV